MRRELQAIYDALLRAYGPRNWWPGESKTEVVIGAILTQNTNWKNVEKAMERLRHGNLIDWSRLRDIPNEELAVVIKPAGYQNLKARRLKNFVTWLWQHHGGCLDPLKDVPLDEIRKSLLSINGIGPETADSILLYALERPSFVVDTFTGRLARRHGLIHPAHTYAELKQLFELHLAPDVAGYNEYHALIVEVGKRNCGPTPRCAGCPLERFKHSSCD
ncbi:MAG: endonuclease III domain-containing protein [Planctomycetes bacterium]|nr:endonuclease III domain-containing protein [Planctomycetota bacterium]